MSLHWTLFPLWCGLYFLYGAGLYFLYGAGLYFLYGAGLYSLFALDSMLASASRATVSMGRLLPGVPSYFSRIKDRAMSQFMSRGIPNAFRAGTAQILASSGIEPSIFSKSTEKFFWTLWKLRRHYQIPFPDDLKAMTVCAA